MFYSEKEAENFLEKNGFVVIKRAYADSEKGLENALSKLTFPVVMKVFGKNIVHKNSLGGIILNIKNMGEAKKAFGKLRQISGFEGVVIQEQRKGKEILIGVKKTRDFGHTVCVGAGGINTEKLKDVSFRVFPFDKKEAEKMIFETRVSRGLNKEEKDAVVRNLLKVCSLIKEYSKILELDINPLMVEGSKAVVVDARAVFE
jgi:acyl-CoA synthetase (NDP forming)